MATALAGIERREIVRSMRDVLRRTMRQRRALLDLTFCAEAGLRLQAHLIARPEFLSAGTISVYLPLRGEAPTERIITAARAAGKRLVLPRVAGDGLRLGGWAAGVLPIRGGCGVLEADGAWPEVAPGEVDLWLVPGVAFDRAGGRLGHGKGHYDRILAGTRGRVGLCWEMQIVEAVPMEPHDQPMQALVTEVGWGDCGGGRSTGALKTG